MKSYTAGRMRSLGKKALKNAAKSAWFFKKKIRSHKLLALKCKLFFKIVVLNTNKKDVFQFF